MIRPPLRELGHTSSKRIGLAFDAVSRVAISLDLVPVANGGPFLRSP